MHTAEYKTLFTKFDRDESESIDPSELGDALRHIGCNPLDSEVETIVADAFGKGTSSRYKIARTYVL